MTVAQYLQHYAEPESNLAASIDFYYNCVMVIPACREDTGLLDRLAKLPTNFSVLVILVHNLPEKSSSDIVQEAISLNDIIARRFPLLASFDFSCTLHSLVESPRQHLLLVDKTAPGRQLPLDQGVGLARKIGCDIACRLISEGRVTHPWIFSTDADVSLPSGYFESCQFLNPSETVCAVLPFQHLLSGDEAMDLAQSIYDFSLHYYVAGLAWANSLYAFQTIGSSMVIHFVPYALTRGFPRKQAGEDFYLLNKLAKLGDIETLQRPVLEIDTRLSDRVPFGTGPAISKIMKLPDPRQDFRVYHPYSFKLLKYIPLLLDLLWDSQTRGPADSSVLLTLAIAKLEMEDAALLQQILDKLGFARGVEHAITHSNHLYTFRDHMNNWFDAFRTLKFIHAARELGLEDIPLHELLSSCPFIDRQLQNQYDLIYKQS